MSGAARQAVVRARDPADMADLTLAQALPRIAAGAAAREDRPGAFPHHAFELLARTGALSFNARSGPNRPPAGAELDLVRRVARADGSVARIFDGHLNAVERVAVQAPGPVRDRELRELAAGRLLGGVWGGDPEPGEGPPAIVIEAGGREALRGVKTFCSGAGGIQRALVIARAPGGGPPLSVWIDLTDARTVHVDRDWYRARGLIASASHRVVFDDAPVLARLGGAGAISQQPWFARDALRTAASWAGMADAAVAAALEELAQRPATGDLEALAAGRMLTAQGTIDAWLRRAADAMDGSDPDLPAVALHSRAAIFDASRSLLGEAARACGSRPFARGGALDRARRDLELFLLQHRLDPLVARAGAAALEEAAS